jgi:hypothetical protein
MHRLLVSLAAIPVLAACGALVSLEDQGTACVVGTPLMESQNGEGPDVTTYEADAPVTINVVLEDCASGCVEDIEASCSVELAGTTLSVSASASYREPSGIGACPDVCVVIDAQCTSPALPAGTHTVEYAGMSTTFDVPDQREPATLGEGSVYCEPSPT